MTKKPFLSIVIPSFNEENNIRTGALSGMVDYLEDQKYTWEIIVVDDGSKDKTADLAEKSRAGREGAPLIRKTMALGFSILRNIVLQLPYKDTQCGFKAFTKDASEKIFKRLQIFNNKQAQSGASVSAGFDLEILYVARKLKLKVAEIPVVWHHKEGTKVNPIKDSWEGFRDLIKVRLNALQGKYKL